MTISEVQKAQYEDMASLYDEAKQNDNGPLMEKIAKTMGQMAKQIKEQEVHERETLSRSECTRLANMLGISLGKAIKKYFPDDERAYMILEFVAEDLDAMAGYKDL